MSEPMRRRQNLLNATPRRPNPVFSEEYELLRSILVEERRRAGLSQAQLAARIGKAKSHIAMIERGQRRVDTLEFYVITKSLGANPAHVFSRVTTALDSYAFDLTLQDRAGRKVG